MKARFIAFVFAMLVSTVSAQYTNIQINTSGNDPEEVSIAVNPRNPLQVAAGANIRYFFVSSNGGITWTQKNMSSSLGVWGDPSLIYDGLGNLFYGHLSNPASGYWIDRIVVQRSTDNGTTWNDGAGIGLRSPKEQDKEWLAVNLSDGPYKNHLYVTWTEFDNYGSSSPTDSSRILFSRSTDHGITWSQPVVVSDRSGDCIDSDNTTEGAVPCVGPNGEIYTSWTGPLGLMFDRSLDGGEKWGRDVFVSNVPGGWDFDVPGIQRCNGFPITACDTSRLAFHGNLYIVWGDQRNGTSNTDVFFIKSTDGGLSWHGFKKVNDDDTDRHQFFPWMTIDQTTGFIYVLFYDRRATTGSATDVYIARSRNGGATFENFKISSSSFTPSASVFFGDYSNIAATQRKVLPMWMRLSGSTLSVWTAPFTDNSPLVTVDAYAFYATREGETNVLHLTQPNRASAYEYIIERSSFDRDNWERVYLRMSRSGSEVLFYDGPFQTKSSFKYRITVIDKTGMVLYTDSSDNLLTPDYSFELMQNYPNPFNPATTISYILPREEFVTLKVFDVLGKECAKLIDRRVAAGVHEVEFSGAGLSAGVFFYRLQAGGHSATRSMILLK